MVFDKAYLPPGYKFQPTGKQLIQNYLIPKVKNQLDIESVSWFLFHKNIYQYTNPLVLFQEIQRNQAFIFTPITKVNSNGTNIKRSAGEGKWHAEDKGNPIRDDDNNVIGKNRMFTFEWNVPKGKELDEVKREKGHWIMHEYSLLPGYYTNNNIKTDPEYVLCEIKCKIPIIDEDAVREEQRQSQPVAKRQRSTYMSSPSMDTVHSLEPPINIGSSTSWVPSPLPEETTMSQFMDSEAAPPLFNNLQSWVPSSPPAATKTMDPYVPLPECELPSDLFSINGESSAAWFPSTPIFSNAELSEWVPSQPPTYVPVPVPAPTTMLSAASMPEFESLTGDEWVDFFVFDDNDLVPAIPAVEDNLNTATPNNKFSESVEELDAAIKEDSSFGVQDAVLPTNQSKDYLSGFSLLLQDEDEGDLGEFAELLEGKLEASNDEPMMISQLGSDTVAAQVNVETDAITKNGFGVQDAVLPINQHDDLYGLLQEENNFVGEDLNGSNDDAQQKEDNYWMMLQNYSRQLLEPVMLF